MPVYDSQIADPEHPRRLDEFKIPGAHELRPHHSRQRSPGKEEQNCQQRPERRQENTRNDNQDKKLRQRFPNFDKPLHQNIQPAAEIALHRTGGNTDQRGKKRKQKSKRHGQSQSVQNARQNIPALIIGTEPVPPRRRGRRRLVHFHVNRIERKRYRRHQHPAVVFDIFAQIGIAVVRRRRKISAEIQVGIGFKQRKVKFTPVFCQKRFVVGQNVGKQTERKHCQKQDKRNFGAPVAAKRPPFGNRRRRRVRTILRQRVPRLLLPAIPLLPLRRLSLLYPSLFVRKSPFLQAAAMPTVRLRPALPKL